MTALEHGAYALLWLSFGAVHSWTAGERLVPWFGRHYRLAYNLLAVLHLAAIWLTGRLLLADGIAPFALPGWLRALMALVALAGAALLLVALRGYDLAAFAGTTQARAGAAADDEPLHTDGLHRYVRHPLYAGAYLLLWGLTTDPFALATALWASLYLFVGSRIEERRLIARYGDAYRTYRARVPAVIPWRGRAI